MLKGPLPIVISKRLRSVYVITKIPLCFANLHTYTGGPQSITEEINSLYLQNLKATPPLAPPPLPSWLCAREERRLLHARNLFVNLM